MRRVAMSELFLNRRWPNLLSGGPPALYLGLVSFITINAMVLRLKRAAFFSPLPLSDRGWA